MPDTSAVVLWALLGITQSDALISRGPAGKLFWAGPSTPEQRWKQLRLGALSARWLDIWAGVRSTRFKTAHAPGLSPSFFSSMSSLRFGECWRVPLCRVSPQWRSSGKTSTEKWDCGAVLCAQPFSPSSDLSYLFFSSSLPLSVSLSLPLPPSASRHSSTHAHTLIHTHMHEWVQTRWNPPLSVSLVNTLAHRHKHTFRQSKSKQRAARERKEIKEENSHQARETMEKGKGKDLEVESKHREERGHWE